MAADFWVSSHYKRWIVDRTTVRRARVVDLTYVDDPIYLDYFAIYFANVITKLGKKLGLRQRVIATATVFFRRFYLKNAYCETDPFLVIAACCYVAAKAEESPVHIKTVISEARTLFSQDMYGIKNFPSDNSKLAEMEFYLVDDLECDLTVFHPYRTLLALCKKESESDANTAEEGEAGELGSGFTGNGSAGGNSGGGGGNLGIGIGADDGPRYWGTGEGKLELSAGALQTAWFIINDTYRSDICLLYPPHLIAISAIYLTFILHNPTRTLITPLLLSSSSSSPSSPSSSSPSQAEDTKPRRSTRSSTTPASQHSVEKKPQQDPITFLSELNVSLPLIGTISQEIISLYTLWDRYKEDAHPEAKTPSLSHATIHSSPSHHHSHSQAQTYGYTNPSSSSAYSGVTALPTPSTTSTPATTTSPRAGDEGDENSTSDGDPVLITPAFLSGLLLKMRESRVLDVAARGHTSSVASHHQHQHLPHHHHQHQHQHHHQLPHHVQQLQQHHGQHRAINVQGIIGGGGYIQPGQQQQHHFVHGHPMAGGRVQGRTGVAVNKMLERTQAAG